MFLLGRDLFLLTDTVDCPEGSHPRIDIRDFIVQYSAYSAEFELNLTNKGTLSGKIDPVKLQELTEAAQQTAEFRKFLVAGYNSCAISPQEYARFGTQFQSLDGLARRIDVLLNKEGLSKNEHAQLNSLVDEYVRLSHKQVQP